MAKGKAAKKDVALLEVPRDLANKIRHVADVFDLTIPEAFDRRLRASIEREYKKAQEANQLTIGGEG